MSISTHSRTSSRTPTQPERVLSLLAGICQANWLALVSMLALFALAHKAGAFDWQQDQQTSQMYLSACLFYGLANLGLQCALHFRGWYEKTPRLAINRLSVLLLVLVAWNLMHVLAAFHFYGGLAGPLNALIPLLLATLFYMLERRQAWIFSLLLLAGLALSQYLQAIDIPYIAETAGRDFFDARNMPCAQAIVLASCVVATLRMAIIWRNSHSQAIEDERFDPLQGIALLSQSTLHKRGEEELMRARRHNTPTSYVVVKLDKLSDVLAQQGMDGLMQALRQSAAQICDCTRQDLDTVAYLGQGCFGVLLPTADETAQQQVMQRIIAMSDSQRSPSQAWAFQFASTTVQANEPTSFEQCQHMTMAKLNQDPAAAT